MAEHRPTARHRLSTTNRLRNRWWSNRGPRGRRRLRSLRHDRRRTRNARTKPRRVGPESSQRHPSVASVGLRRATVEVQLLLGPHQLAHLVPGSRDGGLRERRVLPVPSVRIGLVQLRRVRRHLRNHEGRVPCSGLFAYPVRRLVRRRCLGLRLVRRRVRVLRRPGKRSGIISFSTLLARRLMLAGTLRPEPEVQPSTQ